MLLLIRLATLLLVLFLITGCSSDDGAADEPTAAAAATTESTHTTAAPTTTAATTTEPTEPNRLDEIEALIETYLASWETKDEQALRASVADNFIINENIYTSLGNLDAEIHDDADGLVNKGFSHDWQNEIVGEPVVTGDGPWTVAYRELWQLPYAFPLDGIATYLVIVDDDGALKIVNHTWVGSK